MAWTTPITWAIRDAITALKLNAHLRDNQSYLFDRPKAMATVLGAGSDINTTSTTFVAVDDVQFTLSLTTAAAYVKFNLTAQLLQGVANGYTYFDILIDDATYVSSQSGTPLTNGIWMERAPAAAVHNLGASPVIYPVKMTAGLHTFKLRWRASTSTSTLKLSGGHFFQFTVEEC